MKDEDVTEVNTGTPQIRRSTCAEAALRAEMKRVEKMTVEERMKAALSLGRRFSVVRTTNKGK